MKYSTDKSFCEELDQKDSLKSYKDLFFIPKNKQGKDLIYFCGNSLGLQPKKTKEYIIQEIDDWKTLAVEGHFHAKNPWLPYHEMLSTSYSKLIGAKSSEVIAMNTLTVNLHLMMVSFYKPEKNKFKILIEKDAFPSDIYAVESQIKFHGFKSDEALIKLEPRKGEYFIRQEDIEKIIKENSNEIALILIGGVNYYTGQLFDMQKITKGGHENGIVVGFDLAHAIGNVKLELNKWNVDFAVWCSYKYLNSGPGAIAGAFVNERFHNVELPRFTGWWGHNKKERFLMDDKFKPIKSAEGWQLSNPPIFSLAPVFASLSIFDKVGMDDLIKKSKALTNYLEFLIKSIDNKNIEIIDVPMRGCQLSIRVKNYDKKLFNNLTENGIVADWREPDVIRIAPVPLYNTFTDAFNFYQTLKKLL